MSEIYPIYMPTNRDKAFAWGVHLFTASGVIWGLLGIIAVMNGDWKAVFLWMMVATFVDGVDGMLARRFKVKGVLPDFDGALLDNILDYLTYVILPALFLYNVPGMLPQGWELFGAGIICIASAYQFCQSDAKTEDHTFKGFPSYWNIVIFYQFMLGWNPWINLAVVVFLSIMVFVPIRYAYPSRMTRFQAPTIFLTAVWGLLLLIAWIQFPNHPQLLVYASMFYLAYYVGISLFMMLDSSKH